MLLLKINDSLTVTLYDSIKALPAGLQLEAKQYAIMQSSLATTPEELESRQKHMNLLLRYNRQEEYRLEAYNYDLSIQLMDQNFSALELEWAFHLYAVNDRPVEHHSEDSLIELITKLKKQGLSSDHIAESLSKINEQLLAEIKRYFPARVMRGKLNGLDRLKKYGLALIDHFEQDSPESSADLDKALLEILSDQKPNNLTGGPGDVLVNLEKSHFKLYTTLQESGCTDVRTLTVFEFYNWIEVLEERNERQATAMAQLKKGKR